DKDGVILEVHMHTKGTKGSAPAVPAEMAGSIFNVPGVTKVYSVHNHPSGSPHSSSADMEIHRVIEKTLALNDIEVESLVIAGTSYSDTVTTPRVIEGTRKIRPALRATRVPVKERFFAKKSGEDAPILTNSAVAKKRLKDQYGNQEGILFFDSQLKEIGFMPLPVGKPIKQAAVEILAASDKLNASGIVVNSSEAPFLGTNREAFFKNLRDATGGAIQVFDVLELGKSLGDAGLLEEKSRTKGAALKLLTTEELLDDVEAAKARITTALKSERGSFSLRPAENQATFNDLLIVGRDLYSKGATDVKTFISRLKETLGDAYAKISHIARRLFDSAKTVVMNERGELGDKPKLSPLFQKYVDEFVEKEAEP
ncbi:hypothetical protein LCGC14_2976840, partial [marine sediment metagenome]